MIISQSIHNQQRYADGLQALKADLIKHRKNFYIVVNKKTLFIGEKTYKIIHVGDTVQINERTITINGKNYKM